MLGRFLLLLLCSGASGILTFFMWVLAAPGSGGPTAWWYQLGAALLALHVLTLLIAYRLSLSGRRAAAVLAALSPPALLIALAVVFSSAFSWHTGTQ